MNGRLTRTFLLALVACSAGLVNGLANSPANAQFRWNDDGTVVRIEPPRRSPRWQDAPPVRPAFPQHAFPQQAFPQQALPQQAPLPQFQQPQFQQSPRSSFNWAPPSVAPIDEVRDGGPRPDVQPLAPPVSAFPYAYPAGSIVIDAQARQLFYVLPGNTAFVYQVSVGREGFGWTGTEVVTRKQDWPDWHPPAEMRARDPRLPAKMMGGINNPLGAMAIYLGNTLYRIHGTNDETTLGQAASSGCFRMMNASVLHLASITEVGTRVHVVEALAPPQRISRAQTAPQTAPQTASTPPPARMQAYRPAPPPPRRESWYEWERSPWQRDPQPFPPFGWR